MCTKKDYFQSFNSKHCCQGQQYKIYDTSPCSSDSVLKNVHTEYAPAYQHGLFILPSSTFTVLLTYLHCREETRVYMWNSGSMISSRLLFSMCALCFSVTFFFHYCLSGEFSKHLQLRYRSYTQYLSLLERRRGLICASINYHMTFL